MIVKSRFVKVKTPFWMNGCHWGNHFPQWEASWEQRIELPNHLIGWFNHYMWYNNNNNNNICIHIYILFMITLNLYNYIDAYGYIHNINEHENHKDVLILMLSRLWTTNCCENVATFSWFGCGRYPHPKQRLPESMLISTVGGIYGDVPLNFYRFSLSLYKFMIYMVYTDIWWLIPTMTVDLYIDTDLLI
jgi:hypothetical protein